jgi:signal transduction histidine kinase
MTRRRIAVLLATMVALSGVLPLTLLAAAGLQTVERRGEQGSQEALQAVAEQAAARIAQYVGDQRVMLRTLGRAVGSEHDATRRLIDASLDAPSLGKLRLVSPQTPRSELPPALDAGQIAKALSGVEVASGTYLANLSPAMDVCVPAGRPGSAVCATLDLLELQRQVQRIHLGDSGYALAFDRSGRLLAAGVGSLRAAVLTGEPVAESRAAARLARGEPAPARLRADGGRDVIAGWAALPDLGWTIAVEEPVVEALRGARNALLWLSLGAAAALALSIGLGYAQARRMLAALEMEERFRTAGQIASGISHDLGHRLIILQQIEQLAATGDAEYLPRIRDSLASEVSTLRKFVADFADLTREAKAADFMPIEVNAFAESIRASAAPYAAEAGVKLELAKAPEEIWVQGDRFLLERAALNLARNAVEASRNGTSVLLRVQRRDGSALLQVQDQGAGIDAARLPTLFDSFSSTKRTGAHVGMGLPNVRRIALAHGGAVSVKSKKGEGSTFTLQLPAQSSSPSSS